MNSLPSDLLPMFYRIGSLLLGACGCAEDAKPNEPANVPKNAGSTMDGATFIRTHRRTCFNGCDTAPRSWAGSKDAGSRQEPEVFRAHDIETRTNDQACLR